VQRRTELGGRRQSLDLVVNRGERHASRDHYAVAGNFERLGRH
jgi:hypothetical protein